IAIFGPGGCRDSPDYRLMKDLGGEGGQALALGLPHLVEKLVDLIERADRRRQRVEHQRVLGLPPIAFEQRLDGELVDGHVRAVERRELLGQGTELAGLDASTVDVALDLDAAVEQVFNVLLVADVAVDGGGSPALDRLDDVGAVLEAALQWYRFVSAEHGGDRLVVGLPPLRPVVGVEAALTEVAGTGVLLHEVRALAEVRQVLGEVPA